MTRESSQWELYYEFTIDLDTPAGWGLSAPGTKSTVQFQRICLRLKSHIIGLPPSLAQAHVISSRYCTARDEAGIPLMNERFLESDWDIRARCMGPIQGCRFPRLVDERRWSVFHWPSMSHRRSIPQNTHQTMFPSLSTSS